MPDVSSFFILGEKIFVLHLFHYFCFENSKLTNYNEVKAVINNLKFFVCIPRFFSRRESGENDDVTQWLRLIIRITTF